MSLIQQVISKSHFKVDFNSTKELPILPPKTTVGIAPTDPNFTDTRFHILTNLSLIPVHPVLRLPCVVHAQKIISHQNIIIT